jgi:16S rRNA processing protein RimM
VKRGNPKEPSTVKFIPLGKIMQEWGIRGQVRFLSFNSKSTIYSQLKQIHFEFDHELVPLDLEGVKVHGKYWLLKFKGYENPETARELRGRVLGLPREQMPVAPKGEFYLADLEGGVVFLHSGIELGTIVGFQLVGETEVMKINKGNGTEVLVPYHPDFVESTSVLKKKIILKNLAEDFL